GDRGRVGRCRLIIVYGVGDRCVSPKSVGGSICYRPGRIGTEIACGRRPQGLNARRRGIKVHRGRVKYGRQGSCVVCQCVDHDWQTMPSTSTDVNSDCCLCFRIERGNIKSKKNYYTGYLQHCYLFQHTKDLNYRLKDEKIDAWSN